jgi:4-amino-4-deoxychorismate lyase
MQALSAYDRGLQYGDGLFETIACPDGRPRFLAEHLQRLSEGCRRLHIPWNGAELLREEVGRTAAGVRCIVKVIVTRGETSARGYAPLPTAGPTQIVLRYPWPAVPRDIQARGMCVQLGAMRLAENERLAGIKHLNRLEQVLARAEWSDPAIGESLLSSRSGELISGTMSNVFVVGEKSLRTPRLESCGVHGIMRGVVIREARAAGLDVGELPIAWSEVRHLGEAFLTSSVLGVCPIRELDGRPLTIGPLTRHIQRLLEPLLREPGEQLPRHRGGT